MNFIRSSIILLMAGSMCISCKNADKYISIQGYAQGGTYTVKLNLQTGNGLVKKSPEEIRNCIDSILNCIDTTLSGYNKGSLLSRFNAGDSIYVSRYGMFEDIYTRAWDYEKETDGALDAAAGPIFDLWGFGFSTDSLPSDDKVREVLEDCGMDRLRRDIVNDTNTGKFITSSDVLLDDLKGGVPARLNFNAIAQGYSCDVVAAYLYGLGVKDMLVDIGEIYLDGLNPNEKPWKVGIDRPVDGNNDPGKDLDGIWESDGAACGIVTSGNYRKYYISDGKKYAHTINPRTGYPVEHNLLSATIVAKNATDADAYATYCMVIGLEKAKEFIESRPDELAGYLIYSDTDGKMQEWKSDNFNAAR